MHYGPHHSLRDHQLQTAPWLGVKSHESLPFPGWGVLWLDLLWALCGYPLQLWVHKHNTPSCPGDITLQQSSTTSSSRCLSAPSSLMVPGWSLGDEDVTKMSLSGLSTAQSRLSVLTTLLHKDASLIKVKIALVYVKKDKYFDLMSL